jgi:hypothetical protein
MIARAARNANTEIASPTASIGGPHTSEDKLAVTTNEMVQAVRTNRRQRFQAKHVMALNMLKNPHATWTTVSTC